jgi:hypothetical protein
MLLYFSERLTWTSKGWYRGGGPSERREDTELSGPKFHVLTSSLFLTVVQSGFGFLFHQLKDWELQSSCDYKYFEN